jgi:hypothetical protein
MSSNQNGADDHRAPEPPAFLERIVSSSTVLQNFVDEQRLFRLEKCTELDQALKACIARQKDKQAPSQDETTASESVSMKKIARYYHWNTSEPAATATANTSQNNESKVEIEPCAMETHAVWACRAIGLGCANYMMDLRGCFQEAQEKGDEASTSVMINPCYENSTTTGASVCKAQQQRMAACVLEKGAALDARLKIVKESQ